MKRIEGQLPHLQDQARQLYEAMREASGCSPTVMPAWENLNDIRRDVYGRLAEVLEKNGWLPGKP